MFALLANLSLGVVTGLVAALSFTPDPEIVWCEGCGVFNITSSDPIVGKPWLSNPRATMGHTMGFTIQTDGAWGSTEGECNLLPDDTCETIHCKEAGTITFGWYDNSTPPAGCVVEISTPGWMFSCGYPEVREVTLDFSLTQCGQRIAWTFAQDTDCNGVADAAEGRGGWLEHFEILCRSCIRKTYPPEEPPQ